MPRWVWQHQCHCLQIAVGRFCSLHIWLSTCPNHTFQSGSINKFEDLFSNIQKIHTNEFITLHSKGPGSHRTISPKTASNPQIHSFPVVAHYLRWDRYLSLHLMTSIWNNFYACRWKWVLGVAFKPQWSCNISPHRLQSTNVTGPVGMVHILGRMQSTVTDWMIWKHCSGRF